MTAHCDKYPSRLCPQNCLRAIAEEVVRRTVVSHQKFGPTVDSIAKATQEGQKRAQETLNQGVEEIARDLMSNVPSGYCVLESENTSGK